MKVVQIYPMGREEAKRAFMQGLREVDALTGGDFESLLWYSTSDEDDPSERLDAIGEWLWGCHDRIKLPRRVLDVIGLEPGATFHEAVLMRALSGLLDGGMFSTSDEAKQLYEIFVKDQRGRQGESAPIDRDTFRQWLKDHLAFNEADKLLQAWEKQ